MLLLLLPLCALAQSEPPVLWGDGALELSPTVMTVALGDSLAFTATMTRRGVGSTAVPSWRVDGGALVTNGSTATWTAPWVAGTYHITVQHPEDALLSQQAEVTVPERTVPFAPLLDAPGIDAPLSITPLGSVSQLALWLGDRVAIREPDGSIAIVLPSSAPLSSTPNSRMAVAIAGYGTVILARPLSTGFDALAVKASQGNDTPTLVALHPNGWLVAGAAGNTVTLRDGRDGLVVATYDAGAPIETLVWRPPGALLTVGVPGATRLWNPDTNELTELAVPSRGLHWDQDGQRFVTLDHGDAVWFDLARGRDGRVPGGGDDIVGAATSWSVHDDLLVAHASGVVRRVDEATGTEVWRRDLGVPLQDLWFQLTNQLGLWSNGQVLRIDASTGYPL